MLFERRLREGLLDGSIRVAFRRWRRPQVVAGHHYRLGAGAGVSPVLRVEVVSAEDITEIDALAAGFTSPQELLRDLGGPAEARIYRITFGPVEGDPRDALRESLELEGLHRRVARIAGADQILEAIERQPGRRAGDLAEQLGWAELQPFKLHVRRLKALGLTISLPVGYRLSPRGEAYLRQIKGSQSIS
ncbi:MAG TPA: hypothetical protein VFB50_20970 [Chloroflexota bacterium]|nr:hypothetical protein [Chloroflexota bacterium]